VLITKERQQQKLAEAARPHEPDFSRL